MIAAAEAKCCNPPEQHLHPARDGERFPNNTVCEHDIPPYTTVNAFLEMEFQIDAEDDLSDEHEHENRGEGGVNIRRELASAVGVAEEVADYGEDGTEGLEGNVPTGADNLEGC